MWFSQYEAIFGRSVSELQTTNWWGKTQIRTSAYITACSWFLAIFWVLDPPIFQAETRDGSKYCTRSKAPLNVNIPWQVPYKVSGRFPKHFHGRALNLAPRSWIGYGSRMGCAWSFSFKKQVPNLMIHTYKNSFCWWSNVPFLGDFLIYIYIDRLYTYIHPVFLGLLSTSSHNCWMKPANKPLSVLLVLSPFSWRINSRFLPFLLLHIPLWVWLRTLAPRFLWNVGL